MVLNLPEIKKVQSYCCQDHNEMCWYDQCCSRCPEKERCRATIRSQRARCSLPVSEHADPRSVKVSDHVWVLDEPLTWEGDGG